MVGKAEFAGLAGKWKQSECIGREVSGLKDPQPNQGQADTRRIVPGVEMIRAEYDIKDFAAKNPGTPATSDIVIEYVLADDDFTCNVSVDGTPAVAVKFAYSGDMENQIGDEVSLKPRVIDLIAIYLHILWNDFKNSTKFFRNI